MTFDAVTQFVVCKWLSIAFCALHGYLPKEICFLWSSSPVSGKENLGAENWGGSISRYYDIGNRSAFHM